MCFNTQNNTAVKVGNTVHSDGLIWTGTPLMTLCWSIPKHILARWERSLKKAVLILTEQKSEWLIRCFSTCDHLYICKVFATDDFTHLVNICLLWCLTLFLLQRRSQLCLSSWKFKYKTTVLKLTLYLMGCFPLFWFTQ